MIFSPIPFIAMNLRRLKFWNFCGFSCDGISEDVLCHIFFMLYKMRFLISHRPGQGHCRDSLLVFSDKYLFDFPLAQWNKKKKKYKMEKWAFLQFTRKSWKLQTLLWQCLGDLNNIKGYPGWFFNITQSH